MKVCTDACLLGAYAVSVINEFPIPYNHGKVLDIGTGTGLLSLMIAQETDALVDAIEIEKDAFEQAKHNFELSPFGQRITIFQSDVKVFSFSFKYNLIISNPPFYENDLAPINKNKRVAMHGGGLTIPQLIEVVDKNLYDNGLFIVLIPNHRFTNLVKICQEKGLWIDREIQVHHSLNHPPFRTVGVFRKGQKVEEERGNIFINDESGNYTEEFKSLLKNYYLYL